MLGHPRTEGSHVHKISRPSPMPLLIPRFVNPTLPPNLYGFSELSDGCHCSLECFVKLVWYRCFHASSLFQLTRQFWQTTRTVSTIMLHRQRDVPRGTKSPSSHRWPLRLCRLPRTQDVWVLTLAGQPPSRPLETGENSPRLPDTPGAEFYLPRFLLGAGSSGCTGVGGVSTASGVGGGSTTSDCGAEDSF